MPIKKTTGTSVLYKGRSLRATYAIACLLGFSIELIIVCLLPVFVEGMGRTGADVLDAMVVALVLIPLVVTTVLARHGAESRERSIDEPMESRSAHGRRVSIPRLRIAYMTALGVIAAIVIIRQKAIDTALEPESYGADIVDVAGRQRMISQRIGRNIAEVMRGQPEAKQLDLARNIKLDIEEWDKNSARLERVLSDDQHHGPGGIPPMVAFRVAELRRSLLSQAGRSFASLIESGVSIDELRFNAETYLSRDDSFLEAMGRAVATIAEDLNSDKRRALSMLHMTGLIEVVLLALIGLTIMEPAVRGVQKVQRVLMRQSAAYQRLALVAEKTSNAVIITDIQGRIVWVNEGFRRITGYDPAEVIGHKPGDILQCEKTDPATIDVLRQAVRQQQGARVQILNRGKTENEYWLDIDIQPLYSAKGVFSGFIAVETDITATKEIEHQLQDAWAQAEAATEAKTRFLANMSHEIRTPLNGIIGFAGLLAKGVDDGDESQRAEWVGIIHGSATHLLSLLNDVLDLSKIEASRMQVEILPCRLLSVISEAVLTLQSRAAEKGVYLELKVGKGCPAIGRTDPTRLRQIVLNLVSNAVKFTDRGGVLVNIERAGTPEHPRLRVQIRDTGIGMTEEQAQHLFRPFLQADSSTNRRFGGTGLGLVISRELARKLNGDVTVQSSVGLGSVFTLEIAAEACNEGELTAQEPINKGAEMFIGPGIKPLHGRRLLVVDDNDVNRKLFTMTLRKAGAEVVLAEDGLAGLQAARRETFDVIVMDMQMPVMNGQTTTRTLRSEGYTGQILALTAHSSGGDREETMAAGCDDYLSKPVDLIVLVQTLARLAAASAKNAVAVVVPRLVSDSPDADVRVLADHWLSELPGLLKSLREAHRTGDFAKIADVAHNIRGTSGTIGFPQFVGPASRLEDAALAGWHDGVAEELKIIERLLVGGVTDAGEAGAPLATQRFAA